MKFACEGVCLRGVRAGALEPGARGAGRGGREGVRRGRKDPHMETELHSAGKGCGSKT